MIGVRDAGALRQAYEIGVRGPSALSPVDRVLARTADGLFEVYKRGIRLSAPGTIRARSNDAAPSSTPTVTVAVAGGTPPYTHQWSNADQLTPNNPTGASTSFRIPRGYLGTATATDTVRDANGLTAIAYLNIEISEPINTGDRN